MDNKRTIRGSGIGIGYVSIMIIFAVICLTIFAVLSFQAAYTGEVLARRSEDFTERYYWADSHAKEKLAKLDGIALGASEELFFEDVFSDEAAGIEGVTLQRVSGGVRADFSEEIGDRQSLKVSVTFFSVPSAHGGSRFEITRWQCESVYDGSGGGLNIWDGSF